jgi:uncharacterized GH25 family protein
MRFRLTLVASGVALLSAAGLSAHDTWILPGRSGASVGQEVTFDLTSGMAFPANESAVQPDRLARASVRLGGKVVDLLLDTAGEKALRLKTTFSAAGTATVFVESKPRSLELTPAQVREYLEEIGAWDSIGRRWESGGRGRWRESYTKHAKTYVRVGEADDNSWDRPVGMALELVAESDPARLNVGGELAVRLLKDGRPLAEFPVGLLAAGSKSGSFSKTDSEGRARVRFDRQGWWLVRATVLEPSSKPDLEWESRFATLTIFVGRRRMR